MEDIIDIIVTETTNLIEITSQPTDEVIDVNIIDNREDITLNVTPSVVEININQLTGNFGILWGEIEGTLSNQTDLQNALNLKADLVDGKVPSSQLPSYVDDIVEVATYSALPAIGETGKIYVVLDTNLIYRWSGSAYIEIKDSSAVWGAITGTLSNQTDLQTALNAKANDSEVVKLAGVQTITGIKVYNAIQRFNFGISVESVGGANQGIFGNDNGFNLGVNAYTHSLLFPNSGGYNFTFPATSGTIALTSDLHNAVTLGTANGLSLSTQILSLGLASSSANGALSSTDWTTFNSKQAALSGTGFVKISGTTISYDNSTYLTTSSAASTYLALSGGTLTGAVTGTRLVLVQNSADIALSIVQTGVGRGLSVLGTSYFSSDISFGSLSNGILKANTLGGLVLATAGTDYQAPLSGTGFVKSTGGTISYDTSTYALDSAVVKLTGDQNIDGNKEFILPTTFRLGIGLKNPDGIYNYISSINSGWKINTNNKEHQLLFSTSTAYTYTFPSATGTIALTSNLSSYLPLAGGTLTGALNGTSALFSGAVRANNPSEGATGEGLIAGQSFKIDGTGTSQKAVMYMVSNVLSDTYASGLTAQFANFAGDKAFGFNLNTSGGFELYVKNTSFNKALTIANNNAVTLTGALSGTSATFSGQVNAASKFTWGSSTTGTTGQIATDGTNNYFDYIGSLIFRGAAASNTLVTFTNTGGATFSSSVTASTGLTVGSLGSGSDAVITLATNASGSPRSIYYKASNATINFTQTGGADLMTLTNGGNLGIGTTSPGASLHIVGNSAQAAIISTAHASVFYTTYRYNTSVDVGYIGNGSGVASGGSASDFGIQALGNFVVTAGGSTERMRITSGGELFVGATTQPGAGNATTGACFGPSGYIIGQRNAAAVGYFGRGTDNGQLLVFYRGTTEVGSISVTTVLTTYNTTSDYRLKEDLKPINGLDIVNRIKVYDYKWKSEDSRMNGVLAHELAEVLPYAVTGIKDGEQMQSVDYSKIVPVMVQAIKELKAELDTLKNK